MPSGRRSEAVILRPVPLSDAPSPADHAASYGPHVRAAARVRVFRRLLVADSPGTPRRAGCQRAFFTRILGDRRRHHRCESVDDRADFPEYAAAPSELFSLSVLTSAGDFYGGLIGALIASAIFFWRTPRVPFWRAADLCGPAIALGQAIGRVGCFMAGDDYGRPTHVPWAVTFSDPDAARIGGAPLGVPLHPVQLYESIVCLVLFVVLVRLSRRKRFDGEVILAYTWLYTMARFVLDFRGDADRGFILGGSLSTSQCIALFLGPAAIALWFVRRQSAPAR